MRTITTETQAYTIQELSDKAKERAHSLWLENFEFYGAEYVIDDAKQVAALMGVGDRKSILQRVFFAR